MSLVKYRLREVASDFGVAPKEIVEIVSKFSEKPKSNTQVLTDEELNCVFDYITQANQIKSLEQVFAVQMLRLLSGRDHQVMTGMTVLRGEAAQTVTEITDIHFRTLSEKEIRSYVATGEPMDKAGAYGIQGGAALFAEKMVGDYYNVMGLPVCRLGQILRQMAPRWMEDME